MPLDWHPEQLIEEARANTVARLVARGQVGKLVAQQGAPRLTGRLQGSIHYVVILEGGTVVAGETTDGNGEAIPDYPGNGRVQLIVGTNSGYGLWVDQGTSRMPPRNFLGPAEDAMAAGAMEGALGTTAP